ncbi:hypothetical protein [Longispora fulva]|uniref:hypothetical protein n=1 Tax=Longispora fulva TaxID=619741 RepID=UPI0018CBCD8A|nr:hypothetical protein [Longispora fulva]
MNDVEAQLADALARQRRSWRLPRSTAILLGIVLVVAGFVGGAYTTRQVLTPTPAATNPQQQFPGGGNFQGGFNRGGNGGTGGAGTGGTGGQPAGGGTR